MANTNAPFGFRMLGLSGGSASATFGMVPRKIASNYETAIFHGDPCASVTSGYIEQWVNSTSVVSQLAGVFAGCKYYNTALKRVVWSPYWPGSGATGDVTAYLIPCVQTPSPLFVVQASGDAIGFAAIGSNYDVVLGSGDTLTGISTATIDSAESPTTTSTLPFTVVDVWSNVAAPGSIGSDSTASYNWVIVAANVTQITGL